MIKYVLIFILMYERQYEGGYGILAIPLNSQDNYGRVGMAGMPYPPTICNDNSEPLLRINI